MDCSICMFSLLDKEKTISTTSCGHVFHHDCIKSWLLSKQTAQAKVCPSCRMMVDINRNIVIYLNDENQQQQMIQVKISEINTNLERQNKTINESFGTMMSVIEAQNRQVRNENLEIKDLLKAYQNGGNGNMSNGQFKAQLDAKDKEIARLRVEIQDLKVQRAETARQMTEIQKQVNQLKRDPLAQKNEQKQTVSLSLKFDGIDKMDRADQIIFED